MHIIFGNSQGIDEIKEKYTVLQLETFKVNGTEQTAYCVVEHVPLEEIPDLPRLTGLHKAIVEAWNRQDYDTVLFGLPHVEGKFGGEVDSFYENIKSRIPTTTA